MTCQNKDEKQLNYSTSKSIYSTLA